MLEVHDVTYTPGEDGPELRTSLQIGEHLVSSSRVLRQLDELMPVLGRLMVQIEQVTFVNTPDGPEVHASMRMGDRAFVSTWAVEPDDTDLRTAFDDLLRLSGNSLVRELQDALSTSTEPTDETVEEEPVLEKSA
jgi:hypothetical protein